MLRQLGLGTRRDKGRIDARIPLQHGAQVTKLPAGAALDAEHVDLLVHDPNAALHPVVDCRGLVGKRGDRDLDARCAFLGHINVEEDLLELQSTCQRNALPGDPAAVEAYRQVGAALFVALGLKLNADRNLVPGEGHILHDDIADRNVVGIGDPHRHGVDRNPACPQITNHRLDSAGRSVQPVREQHDAGQGRPAFRFGDGFECSRDRGSRLVRPQGRKGFDSAILAHPEPLHGLAKCMVTEIKICAERLEYRSRRLREQVGRQIEARGRSNGIALLPCE